MNDKEALVAAIKLSAISADRGGFPCGAILLRNGEVFASGISNGVEQLNDPTSHAETAAIRAACRELRSSELKDFILYTSLEPCLMCFAASVWAAIPRIVYACGRARVPAQYYEGNHNLTMISDATHKPLELVHLQEFEADAVDVINAWEAKLSKKRRD